MLEQAGASADDIVKIKKYVRKEYMDSFDMTRTSVHDKWDEIVYSEVIADKFINEGQLLETEIFAIVGCGGHRRLDCWGTIDFRKDVKGELGKFAEYVKVGPFLYGGLHHCLDELGIVVGIGDSERQESYLVSKFTEDIRNFGFVPEEMVKFKAYYTEDFGRLYGESEVPAYEKIYKPVKPLYTGVYVSLTGKEEEIFEMEMLAVQGAVEKSGC
jgi:hypothetical protein